MLTLQTYVQDRDGSNLKSWIYAIPRVEQDPRLPIIRAFPLAPSSLPGHKVCGHFQIAHAGISYNAMTYRI